MTFCVLSVSGVLLNTALPVANLLMQRPEEELASYSYAVTRALTHFFATLFLLDHSRLYSHTLSVNNHTHSRSALLVSYFRIRACSSCPSPLLCLHNGDHAGRGVGVCRVLPNVPADVIDAHHR